MNKPKEVKTLRTEQDVCQGVVDGRFSASTGKEIISLLKELKQRTISELTIWTIVSDALEGNVKLSPKVCSQVARVIAGDIYKKLLPNPWVRVAAGGAGVILLAYALGTRAYLGIGVHPIPGEENAPYIAAAFTAGGVGAFAWFWKTIFTGLTLGAGFKGGEVTPLFFTGACLGNAVSGPLAMPPELGAALGFAAVFAGAANTPLAGTLLGIELFGGQYAPFFAAACFAAYKLSGPRGIYTAQRRDTDKALA